MSRQLAILVTGFVVVWLWREDGKHRPGFPKSLWLPLVWLLISGSRPFSWWLWFFFGISGGGASSEDGDPLDRLLYASLIVGSIAVVSRRIPSWVAVIRDNIAIAVFLGFLGLTILWSEFPFATLKRWVKELGAVPVMMVMLTAPSPIDAIKAVFTRCAFILFSTSVLLIKYIPELGRVYGGHGGEAQIVGVSQQKNSLGEVVVVCGLILVWQLVGDRGFSLRNLVRRPRLQWAIMLAVGAWLLIQCDSKTSIVCLALGAAIIVSSRISFLSTRRVAVAATCLLAGPIFFALDSIFQISGSLLGAMGRDATLTNRTNIWEAISQNPADPLVGCGFMNYWQMIGHLQLGTDEVELKTAHNGYIDIYLDGGILGVFFLVVMCLGAARTHVRSFLRGHSTGALGFSIFNILLLANISESIFARRTILWVTFLMLSIYARRLLQGDGEAISMAQMRSATGGFPLPSNTASSQTSASTVVLR